MNAGEAIPHGQKEKNKKSVNKNYVPVVESDGDLVTYDLTRRSRVNECDTWSLARDLVIDKVRGFMSRWLLMATVEILTSIFKTDYHRFYNVEHPERVKLIKTPLWS